MALCIWVYKTVPLHLHNFIPPLTHKTLASLTEEEIINLGFYNHGFRVYFLPCASTVHYFVKYRVKYRLGEKDLQEVMILLGKEIAQISSASDAKTDSTECV